MLQPGETVLGRYEVEGLIGEGGMGRVYRARHARLGHRVALKVLHQVRPQTAARFEREAELMARVRHPNVVALLDYGLLGDGRPCIAMEHVDGQLLDERLAATGAVPWAEALDILVGILDGLDAIHAQAVLHRDLKPGNVLLVPSATGQPRPKLLDFGIAKAIDDEGPGLTRVGSFVGTPAYASPEQLFGGPLDARSDLYSATLLFHELVAGALPFDTDTLAALLERTQRHPSAPLPPPGLPPLPSGLAQAVHAALSPQPDARPGSARSYARALREVRRGLVRMARPEAISPPDPRPRPSGLGALAATRPRALQTTAPWDLGGSRLAVAAPRPCATAPRARVDAARRRQPSQRHGVIGHALGGACSDVVLIVEDDPDVRQQLLEVLTDERFHAVAVDDGAPALAWLYREPRPALILTDWWMPRVDGGALLSELRQNDQLAEIPVAVITADPNIARKTDPRRLAGVLKKPVAVQELVELVGRYAAQRPRAG